MRVTKPVRVLVLNLAVAAIVVVLYIAGAISSTAFAVVLILYLLSTVIFGRKVWTGESPRLTSASRTKYIPVLLGLGFGAIVGFTIDFRVLYRSTDELGLFSVFVFISLAGALAGVVISRKMVRPRARIADKGHQE